MPRLENSFRKVYLCNRSVYWWGEREKEAGKKGKEKEPFFPLLAPHYKYSMLVFDI